MENITPNNTDYVLSKLMVPKNNEKSPAAAELFFAALHGTYDFSTQVQPVMSFEIVSINKYIQFYFYTPRHLREFVEGQFYAQYPNVEISTAEDYAANMLGGKHVIGLDFKMNKDDSFPIKTFQSFEVDPLSSITSILSQIDGEDELWIQICVSPADDNWQKKGLNYVKAIKSGRDPSETIWRTIAKGMYGVAKDIIVPPKEAPSSGGSAELSGPLSEALTGIETKTTKLGYKTKIRIVSLSADREKAIQKLNGLVGAFKQFNQSNMNGFSQGNLIEGDSIINLYKSRSLEPVPYIMNIEELASIYHLPNESVETPTMDWAGSRKGEPPLDLPLEINVPPNELSVIGITNYRNAERKFGIKIKDRALHTYAIGKTGTGKSNLLKTMIIDDIIKGRGVAVVDPHGDLINDIMEFIPDERVEDVVYFSPADRNFPIGFNLLENVDPEYKNIVSSGIVGVFKKIFGESWGPRLEYILRNVVLGLLDYPGATMLSIIKVLTDTKFRREVVEKISDPVIKDFFVNEYERYDQKFRTEAVAPIQNKVGQFLSSTIVRNIVGQKNSTMDLRSIMDNKKILLLDLSIGKIGEDNSALLGSMLITKIQMAAMSRADMSKDERVPFYLYVDEFQNFATDSFAVILSEARKYGLCLMVTNQYIAQMPETVANAVFGNVGTLIVFRVGASDADALQREFVPVFDQTDLTNLNNYNIYIKMAIDGVTSVPFSSKTILTNYPLTNNVEKIIEQSRAKYSKPRDEVEQIIADQSSFASQVNVGEILDNDNTEKTSIKSDEVGESSEKIIEENTEENEKEVPEDLKGFKVLEDYDGRKWYFLNRTKFRSITSRNEDGTYSKRKIKDLIDPIPKVDV